MNKGQSLADYALIVFIVILVIVILVIIMRPIFANSACFFNGQNSVECKTARVEQCVQDEKFSRNECIDLIGGGS